MMINLELWIRSQNRESLVKVNDISIEMNMIYGYFDKNTEYELLGQYKTKERALEVLDNIEDKLINCTFAQKQNSLGEVLDFMPNSIYVYKMPKE